MQKTIRITREDLKVGKFKNSRVENFGIAPTNRDVELITRILKKHQVKEGNK